MFRRSLVAVATCLAALATLPTATASAEDDDDGGGGVTFGDNAIELDDGSWDGARACAVVASGVQCFATEAEMNAWLAGTETGPTGFQRIALGQVATQALSCSSTLRLYEHGWFGGRVLYFSSRGQWFNLSSFSFSNKTSSFRVGACSTYLADYNSGGGGWYPGGGAYASVGSVPSSWNDRVSSIYLV